MGNKFKFIDDNTKKSKKTHFQHTEEDIELTLPDDSGTVVTTNTVDDILDVDDNGNPISGYILKPDIGDNAGIVNEYSNLEPINRAPYVTSNAYVGPLEYTKWEASLNSEFTTLVDTTSNVKDRDLWLPNVVTPGTDVYVRYRFYSGDLRSPWSDTIHYRTPVYGIKAFTVTVNDSIKPLIKTSGFQSYGEEIYGGPITHDSTSWVINKIDESGNIINNPVFQSIKNKTDKLQIQLPVGVLEELTEYVIVVTYHSQDDTIYRKSSMTFITPKITIDTPVLTHTGDNSVIGVVINKVTSSKYKINHSDEQHLYTEWKLYAWEDDKKKLIHSVNDLVNKTTFDITSFAYNGDIFYQVECVYHSANFKSDVGYLKFKVKPFRTPALTLIPITKPTDLTNNPHSYVNNISGSLVSQLLNYGSKVTPEGFNQFINVFPPVKSANYILTEQWSNTDKKYMPYYEIFDISVNGPMILITSDSFVTNSKSNPVFDFERLIIRVVDNYKVTDSIMPNYTTDEVETLVMEIDKENIKSFVVQDGNKYRRIYFFYPLEIGAAYDGFKIHDAVTKGLSLKIYFEHTKFNTDAYDITITDPSWSDWNNAFKYTYNANMYNANSDYVGSFEFVADTAKIPNIYVSNTTYKFPYITDTANKIGFDLYKISPGDSKPTFLKRFDGYALSGKRHDFGCRNLTHKITGTDCQYFKYSDTDDYFIVPLLTIYICKLWGNLGNSYPVILKGTPFALKIKRPKIANPSCIVKATSINRPAINLELSNTLYNYQSSSPVLNNGVYVWPLFYGPVIDPNDAYTKTRDYNSNPKSITVTVLDSSNKTIYTNVYTNVFSPATMPNDVYSILKVNNINIAFNNGELKYNTNYTVAIQLEALNGLKSNTTYTTFNTGNPPQVVIQKPTITAAQVTDTKNVTTTSNAFKVTGLVDTSHKATEWLVYEPGKLNTPIYSKIVTATNQLTNFSFSDTAYQNAVFWGKTYVFGVRYQASNGDWSEIGYTSNTVLRVPQAWNDIPVAGLGDLYQNGTKFDYKVTSLRHPQMQYAKSFHVQLILTAPEDLWSKYDGTYKANMSYGYASNSTRYYSYKKDIVLPFKDANPISYIASIACDLSCWTLIYNADYWIEWYDGSTTIHSDGVRTGSTNTPASYGFTQEELDDVNPNPGFAYSTKQVKVIDRITAPKVSLTHGIFAAALAVKGQITNFELGTKPPGINCTSWYLYKPNDTNTPADAYELDENYIDSITFSSRQFPLNSEYIIKAKYVNTKYGYETPIGTSITFNPAAVITMPYFKVTVDWSTQEFVISDFYYPFDQYVKGYALSVFRRTNYNSNGCTDLNGKTATYNNVINTPLFKKATTNYRCFCIFSWNRNEPPSYPRSTFRGPEFINVPDGWTEKHSYPNLVNGLCGPNDTVHVDLSCQYNEAANTIDTSGAITTRLSQIIPNETIDPNTTIIQYPKCQFNGLGTWRKSLGKSPNGQRFKLHLDDNLWTLPKVNGKYSYVSTNILIIPVFHDNTCIYRSGTFDATAFNNRWTASTIKRHTVQTANGYKVDNQIFANAAVTWAEIIVYISPT